MTGLVLIVALGLSSTAYATESDYHHVHLMAPDANEAAAWYIEHMGCQAYAREGACRYGDVQILFIEREADGGSIGTSVDHVGFSFKDLGAKMADWKAAGLHILEDVREVDGLFKLAFVEDPWGTKIEAVEDHEDLGLHHLHLRSMEPVATLDWYHNVFGGEYDSMKGRINGLRWGRIWLLASKPREGTLAPTRNRSLHHLGWSVADLEAFTAKITEQGLEFSSAPRSITNSAGENLIIAFMSFGKQCPPNPRSPSGPGTDR